MGKFIVTKRVNDEFQFNLKTDSGENILTSDGYNQKNSCLIGIEAVRAMAHDDARYVRKIAKNDREYFVLRAKNGRILGKSRLYYTELEMENGINSLKINAPNAEVIDETIDYIYDNQPK
ncbi:hypothetical protein SAMN05421856_10668 [Chryseobacterium taichungense]|uniref:DUF1508 domain-containing protein n=1 Tax=Chryseobacterium taichungense TaxID=295069 RepID=A0A1H8ATZ1_9FLAO|nr:YegP family protein [Chryseobacterium taichungense]SEM74013.1 hypothetical protein SAMN05421856_10668 [Chryseobacterium taichungense]